ncbi:MAG: addiction module component, family protein [Acidobacteria bacterium]|nr:MAG: addiction module component, family protein [Acidobacteriota bacterium]
MTHEANELLRKALALPAEERAELASTLIDSLDPITDEQAEAAWQVEISRRIEELRSGKAKTIAWDVVRKETQAILNGKTKR